jgi:hypothetical protein
MSESLICRISRRKVDGTEMYEGTINLQGVQPTKLIKSGSTNSRFANRSALAASARSFARRYGFENVEFEDNATARPPAKKQRTKRTTTTATTATVSTPIQDSTHSLD